MHNLIYTLIANQYRETPSRTLAKTWTGSLLCSVWEGEIHLAKDFEEPLFLIPRKSVTEHSLFEPSVLDNSPVLSIGRTTGSTPESVYRKARLQTALDFITPDSYDWIILSDPYYIALRNLDHLFESEADILVESLKSQDRYLDFVAIRRPHFHKFVSAWLNLIIRNNSASEAAAYNSNLFETAESLGLKVDNFEHGEISSLHDNPACLLTETLPAIVHVSGDSYQRRVWLASAIYLATKYSSPRGIFLDFIDM